MTIPVIGLEKVLADEDLGPLGSFGRFPDLLVEHDERAGCGERQCGLLDLGFVLTRFEGQVEQSQGEEHLGKIACRFGQISGQEHFPSIDVMFGIIAPESIQLDPIGNLLLDRQLVIVVLGPLLGLVEPLEELTNRFAALGVFPVVELDRLSCRFVA